MALTQISTAGVKDDAVTAGKIPANAVGSSELADNAVDTNAIQDQAVALSKLPHGDSNNNGKFLRANNGADPTFETVNTDLVADTSPQLGGQLQSNGQHINLEDSDKLKLGTNGDTELYHNNTDAYIQNHTGDLYIENVGSNSDDITIKAKDNVSIRVQTNESAIECFGDGSVDLYYDNSKKLETKSQGFALMEDSTTRLSFTYSNSLNFITANAGNEIKVSSGNGDANGIEFWDYSGVNKRCQIDGHGIKFNSDTAAANALDDYEEGTFTPTINPGLSVTYNTQFGRYIKIGGLVYFTIYVGTNSVSGSSSATHAQIHGLPYASADYNGMNGYDVCVSWIYQLGQNVNNAYVQEGTTYIQLLNDPTGGNREHTPANSCWDQNSLYIMCSGTYTAVVT